jgi:hypothetical protein
MLSRFKASPMEDAFSTDPINLGKIKNLNDNTITIETDVEITFNTVLKSNFFFCTKS